VPAEAQALVAVGEGREKKLQIYNAKNWGERSGCLAIRGMGREKCPVATAGKIWILFKFIFTQVCLGS
jgi:hypothetical protein